MYYLSTTLEFPNLSMNNSTRYYSHNMRKKITEARFRKQINVCKSRVLINT
jgi:hypothetical protein